jgi:hypothetical protein
MLTVLTIPWEMRLFLTFTVQLVSQYSDQAMGWKTGVRFPAGIGKFSHRHSIPDLFWGPPNFLSNGYRGALYLEVKRLFRETIYSPPFNAEILNAWSYIFIPPDIFMAYYLIKNRICLIARNLVKHKDKFTLPFFVENIVEILRRFARIIKKTAF